MGQRDAYRWVVLREVGERDRWSPIGEGNKASSGRHNLGPRHPFSSSLFQSRRDTQAPCCQAAVSGGDPFIPPQLSVVNCHTTKNKLSIGRAIQGHGMTVDRTKVAS
ncbi:hypothetical protein DPEC_G00003020 [Dallia pectoralis]|uniref:Uncharacterized protein n=1 Tax=Dallia pectoralis TaxID=75939 RepID=A0ACC2HJN4_DALPE|nr:hypothetical protein DPEC_G00003020 [Dallia pectoralis]